MTDTNFTPAFEEFMKQEHAENHAENVLDDDMVDSFEDWIGNLDEEEIEFYTKKFNQTNK